MNFPLEPQTELPLLVPREAAPPPNEAPRPPRTGEAAPLWSCDPHKIFGGLPRPRLACVRGTEEDPREAPAAMFKAPKVSPGEEASGGPRATPKLGVSQEFSLDSDPSELRSRGPLQRSSSKKVQAEGGPSRPPHVPQSKPLKEEEERGHIREAGAARRPAKAWLQKMAARASQGPCSAYSGVTRGPTGRSLGGVLLPWGRPGTAGQRSPD